MESTLNIIADSIADESASHLTSVLKTIINRLQSDFERLDLRRMNRVIITANLGNTLLELYGGNKSKATFTEEKYATAMAKVVLLRKDSGFEIVPVIDSRLLLPFTNREITDTALAYLFHLIHHELCHVHDENQKIAAFPDIILKTTYIGKQAIIMPLVEAVWSEYFAERYSSQTIDDETVSGFLTHFRDALIRTKPLVDSDIYRYRTAKNINTLLEVFSRHGHFLPKAAAYWLGCIDSIEVPQVLTDKLMSELQYFDEPFHSMHSALKKMYDLYPKQWKTMAVYDELAAAMERYYNIMGFYLIQNTTDGLYIEIPLRPETNPSC